MKRTNITFATNTPITAVASSGPDDPAAMKVAPATSGGIFKTKQNSNMLCFIDSQIDIFELSIPQLKMDLILLTFSNSIQSRYKKIVTYDGQSNKHVYRDKNVY